MWMQVNGQGHVPGAFKRVQRYLAEARTDPLNHYDRDGVPLEYTRHDEAGNHGGNPWSLEANRYRLKPERRARDIISIDGVNLGPSNPDEAYAPGVPMPLVLGGAQVLVNDVAAPLLAASPGACDGGGGAKGGFPARGRSPWRAKPPTP